MLKNTPIDGLELPETGVFLTRDPAGMVDGPNLYTYVIQNPWSSFDPLGLQTRKERARHGAALERFQNNSADFLEEIHGGQIRSHLPPHTVRQRFSWWGFMRRDLEQSTRQAAEMLYLLSTSREHRDELAYAIYMQGEADYAHDGWRGVFNRYNFVGIALGVWAGYDHVTGESLSSDERIIRGFQAFSSFVNTPLAVNQLAIRAGYLMERYPRLNPGNYRVDSASFYVGGANYSYHGFKFGKHLRNLKGDPPPGMSDPHAHHILFKKGMGTKQQALVEEGQNILRKAGIDPIFGPENLVWAPWRVSRQHGIETLEEVVGELRKLEASGGEYVDFVDLLDRLGRQAARRPN